MAHEKRWFLWLLPAVLLVSLAAYRDIREVTVHQQMDLRNRVVGARLITDKRLPYFYRWQPGDPVRYYDPKNADPAGHRLDTLSVITATPLFHHLLEPVAELQQSRVIFVWLGIEYLAWMAILVLFLSLAATPSQKLAVLAAAVAFLFSMPWKVQVEQGQYYILVPLLAALGYRLLQTGRTVWTGIATGVVAVVMVGIRPNTAVFFLPFLLAGKRFSLTFRVGMAATAVLLVTCMAASPFERALWQQYRQAVSSHIRSHLDRNPWVRSEPDPHLPLWEGIDQFHRSPNDVPTTNENGNFFLLLDILLHRKIGLGWLTFFAASSMSLLCAWFLKKNYRRPDISLAQLAMFGYCLYMLTDLFSPVTRWLYYAVQWLFPILLALATFPLRKFSDKALLIVGLVVGAGILVVGLPFAHVYTAGEYLCFFTFLALTLTPGRWTPSNQPQTSILSDR